jgi:tRNA G37 N-methylase TrmD
MSATISPEQRDALYDQILDRLTGIGDIEIAIRAGNFDTANRLGREYSDDLRLLVDDLGFGDGGGEPVVLSTPPEVLRRALVRLRDLAVGHSAGQEAELAELRQIRDRSRLVAEACASVLDELDGSAEAPI